MLFAVPNFNFETLHSLVIHISWHFQNVSKYLCGLRFEYVGEDRERFWQRSGMSREGRERIRSRIREKWATVEEMSGKCPCIKSSQNSLNFNLNFIFVLKLPSVQWGDCQKNFQCRGKGRWGYFAMPVHYALGLLKTQWDNYQCQGLRRLLRWGDTLELLDFAIFLNHIWPLPGTTNNTFWKYYWGGWAPAPVPPHQVRQPCV